MDENQQQSPLARAILARNEAVNTHEKVTRTYEKTAALIARAQKAVMVSTLILDESVEQIAQAQQSLAACWRDPFREAIAERLNGNAATNGNGHAPQGSLSRD